MTNTPQELNHLPILPAATGMGPLTSNLKQILVASGPCRTPSLLIRPIAGSSDFEPLPGVDLAAPDHHHATRCCRVFQDETVDPMALEFNSWLNGGPTYPILTGILGVTAGLVPGVGLIAGLAWSAATTAISNSNAAPNHRVRIRDADQIWVMEVVGRVTGSSLAQAFRHVRYYIIVDPHRRNTAGGAN